MTKDFYEKNYKAFVPIIESCEDITPEFCDDCPIGDACLYYFTGDDSEFRKEKE